MQDLSIKQLVEKFNSLPGVKPLTAWKGKKTELIEKIIAATPVESVATKSKARKPSSQGVGEYVATLVKTTSLRGKALFEEVQKKFPDTSYGSVASFATYARQTIKAAQA